MIYSTVHKDFCMEHKYIMYVNRNTMCSVACKMACIPVNGQNEDQFQWSYILLSMHLQIKQITCYQNLRDNTVYSNSMIVLERIQKVSNCIQCDIDIVQLIKISNNSISTYVRNKEIKEQDRYALPCKFALRRFAPSRIESWRSAPINSHLLFQSGEQNECQIPARERERDTQRPRSCW